MGLHIAGICYLALAYFIDHLYIKIVGFNYYMLIYIQIYMGFPGGTVVKNSPANSGDAGLIPESGRFTGGGNGNLMQYSCLEIPSDRGAWRATVHGVTKSRT